MMNTDTHVPPACRRLLALADRDPRRAVPLVRRALERTPTSNALAYAWASYALGYALLCWERFDEARDTLRDADVRFGALGEPLAQLRCRAGLLRADLIQLAPPALEEQLATLADALMQAGAPLDAARVCLDQARLFNVQGHAREAQAVLERIAPIVAQASPIEQARALRLQGESAILQGDYTTATRLLADAEQVALASGNRVEAAMCWANQGWCALDKEEWTTALTAYRRTEQTFIKLDMPLRLAFCGKTIGFVYTRTGHYQIALFETLKALSYFSKIQRFIEIAVCHLHLGNIYFYTGHSEAALAHYVEAEQYYASAKTSSYQLIARRNQAMVYRLQGRRIEARELLAEVEEEARQRSNQTELAEIWNVQAALFVDEGHDTAAAQHYQQAQTLFAHIENVPAVAECAMELGWLALQRGAEAEAQSLFESAQLFLQDQPHHYWRIVYGLARCAVLRGDDKSAVAYYQTASSIIGTLRQRLASEAISGSLSIQAKQLYANALTCAARLQAPAEILALSEAQRALVLLRLLNDPATPLPSAAQIEHDQLRAKINALLADTNHAAPTRDQALDAALNAYGELLLHARHSIPSQAETRDQPVADSFELDQLRMQLIACYGEDWTVLVYTFAADTLLITTITPRDLLLAQTRVDHELQRLLERVIQPRYRSMTFRDLPYLQGQTARPWQNLRQLAERLLPAAVQSRLHPDHRLLIVPAGSLHALPWAALRLETDWLVERAVIQLAPSLAVWQTLNKRVASDTTAALLVGCSAFGERAEELPNAAAELATVAKHWPGPHEQLIDAEASRIMLLARAAHNGLRDYQLLHVATHGRLMSTLGQAAHVKLWDDDLWLADIAGLGLHADLVVLSACEGAAADVLPGDEVMSLSWAFLAAGARCVLASLWTIYDKTSVPFVTVFYQALREQPDAARALARAQRAIIAQHTATESIATLPEHWANLVITGAPI